MEKKTLAFIALLLTVLCVSVILTMGKTCTVRFPMPAGISLEDLTIGLDPDTGIVRIEETLLQNGVLTCRIRAGSRGKAILEIRGPDHYNALMFYVHPTGIVTAESYIGRCDGSWILPGCIAVYIAVLLCSVVMHYRKDVRYSLYQYRNIRNMGWIILLSVMLLGQFPFLTSKSGLMESLEMSLSALKSTALYSLPVAFFLSVLVTLSNVKLMRREGRTWRNLLGFFLGLALLVGTLFPVFLGEFLQHGAFVNIIDVHYEKGAGRFIEMAVTGSILTVVSYLECILAGTVILGIKAARGTPDPDRDYMMILGCQIRDDGTLTPLLKGRADRALDFARMQREKTGRDLIFVPSGGKGDDEVIAEGQAIRNYLISRGIPEERILTEDRSVNTLENMKYSLQLIREHSGQEKPKIGFSTTNYHVFRAGILAEEQGLHAQGIGSPTKSYFWLNAFIREFIATMYAERKRHFLAVLVLLLILLGMVGLMFWGIRI